ncbi:MAG: 5'-nucleotidase C-terminal domain-containing protein [Flavobacteriales bacterium]|nr:5'-nucleotidase C-terminal domain-containing protein [Flavobacteriales bacterium]
MRNFFRLGVVVWFALMIQACVVRWHVNEITYTKISAGRNVQSSPTYDSIITPYRKDLESQMNEVIGISLVEMPKQKDQQETLLGNFVADLVYKTVTETMGLKADACLLNIGGLRSSLPKGNITRGNIFSLAPFENELVLVEINYKIVQKLLYSLTQKPQPIAGFTMLAQSDGTILNLTGSLSTTKESYMIITTDYLANGGDNMDFFKEANGRIATGIKLRDMIIDYIKQSKEINSKLDQRLQIIR